ncbi:flagellar biosynthetic protein FliO [Shewanella benthica]|uniref:flagellar biosynthetic protein FliO n=1 Tax=Shewanella TaxID=22 RepID=UPI00187A82B9|nr:MULTISPECIES: flagellar biosynthetic protein FliO [Shewanella]MBE7213880.1 flagellar biosynthetic protein FliO [Shewanella benthica]MBL4814405.1 flagellar biosynthetic protein FliO [Shewanella sp.]MCJ8303700.1 flagellar biosynthetic protein FliO [Shewanella sp.]MCL1061786.1 flagellar biosynthetic protein FliO [Shewanella benthica]
MINSLFVSGLAASPTVASTTEKGSAISTMSNMLGGLIVVLAIIFVLAYIVKRLKLAPSSHSVLKTLAVMPLGQKEKVVLLEVGGQQYLLGVTAQQIQVIDKLDTPISIETESFAERLRQAKTNSI